MASIMEKLANTKLSNTQTKSIISKSIRLEFDKKETTEERCLELLQVAYEFELDCFDEMLNDYKITFEI